MDCRDRKSVVIARVLVEQEVFVHLLKSVIGFVDDYVFRLFFVRAISAKQREFSIGYLHGIRCVAIRAELDADISIVGVQGCTRRHPVTARAMY